MKRKRFSERQVIETLAHQGITVSCFRCHKPFLKYIVVTDSFEWLRLPEREHIHELALGGADEPCNCRYGCVECHKTATNGNGATSAGSSKHRIAKLARLLGETKTKPRKKIPSRPFQKRK